MSRSVRNLLDQCSYHVTHRCHNRQFLFRFTNERDSYVKLLREMSRRFKVDVLDYMVTSNHVHLLLWAKSSEYISEGMRFVQGTIAQNYNRKCNREGAFWRDRFHATLIQDGAHLSRCLFYIEFNMVRAGVVAHPRDWRWSGYDELTGKRQRYRVLNRDCLAHRLGHQEDEAKLSAWFMRTMDEKVDGYHTRESWWSESMAVGDAEWIRALSGKISGSTKKIERISSDYGIEINEDSISYRLQTSKRGNATITRSLSKGKT